MARPDKTATQADQPALFFCPIRGASSGRAVWRSSLWQQQQIRPSPPPAGRPRIAVPAGPCLDRRRLSQAVQGDPQAPPLRRPQRGPPVPRQGLSPAVPRADRDPRAPARPRARQRAACLAVRALRHGRAAARAADLHPVSAAAMVDTRSQRRARSAKLNCLTRSRCANWG